MVPRRTSHCKGGDHFLVIYLGGIVLFFCGFPSKLPLSEIATQKLAEIKNGGRRMPRLARVKIESGGAYYHLYSRTAGLKGEFPLDNKLCRRKMIDLIEHLSRVYCCKIIGFSMLGNHYHLLLWLDEHQKMAREELWKRAALLYPETLLRGWLRSNWDSFEERIFDLSEFMRNFQAAFARWYNQTFGRRGRFWAERFKSTLLEDEKQMIDCLLYVELNPVRAGIVERPEEYEGSSVYYREIGKDKWMMPLPELLGQPKRAQAVRDYKAMLYYRGNVPTREGQRAIPDYIIKAEEARGFKSQGVYRKRLRYWVQISV
jgi:putative transposase